jgi:hypothetical protein
MIFTKFIKTEKVFTCKQGIRDARYDVEKSLRSKQKTGERPTMRMEVAASNVWTSLQRHKPRRVRRLRAARPARSGRGPVPREVPDPRSDGSEPE